MMLVLCNKCNGNLTTIIVASFVITCIFTSVMCMAMVWLSSEVGGIVFRGFLGWCLPLLYFIITIKP